MSSRSDADAKFTRHSVSENYFETNYPPLPLPMIWRVIYHEAVRGNHILWEKADLDAIELEFQSPNFKLAQEDKGAITRFMARFHASVDYNELRAMICQLPRQQKAVAFLLYRRAISVWQTWLKSNLH